MSGLWLTKDTATVLLRYTDFKTTYALSLSCRLFYKEIKEQKLLWNRMGDRMIDFRTKDERELRTAEVRQDMEEGLYDEVRLNVVAFGLDGSGKSASIVQFCAQHFIDKVW